MGAAPGDVGLAPGTRRARPGAPELEDLALAPEAVVEVLVELAVDLEDRRAVPGEEGPEASPAQAVQGLEVLVHVPFGRVDDDRSEAGDEVPAEEVAARSDLDREVPARVPRSVVEDELEAGVASEAADLAPCERAIDPDAALRESLRLGRALLAYPAAPTLADSVTNLCPSVRSPLIAKNTPP